MLLIFLGVLLLACTSPSSVEYEAVIPAQKLLVHNKNWNNTHPSWHSSGKRLLFCARATDGSGSVYLREVNITDKSVRTLTADSTGLWFPSWNPSDSTILCTSSRAGSQDLWLYTPATAIWRRLTSLSGNESFPRWSPDGSRIAFLSLGRIALLDPATAEVTYLPTPFLIALSLSWSPNGESLLFSADNAAGEFLYRYLLAENRFEELFAVPQRGSWPVAAPAAVGDGEHIAWRASTGSGTAGIYFQRPGAEKASLAVREGVMPAWSPDGTALVHVEDLPEKKPVAEELGLDLVWEKVWIAINE